MINVLKQAQNKYGDTRMKKRKNTKEILKKMGEMKEKFTIQSEELRKLYKTISKAIRKNVWGYNNQAKNNTKNRRVTGWC